MPSALSNAIADPPIPAIHCRPLNVTIVNPLEMHDWDREVLALPGADIFHSRAWAQVLTGTYDLKPMYVVARDGEGVMRGVLPIMEARTWLTQRRGVSLPFTDHCAPIASDPGVIPGLQQHVLELGKERGWNYVEFKGGPPPRTDAQPSVNYYRHTLDLNASVEVLFRRMHPSTRRAVRKAEKCGVKIVRSGSKEEMNAYYRLHCLTRKRHGLPPQPRAFFDRIQESVLAMGFGHVAVARMDGKPVAAAVFFMFGTRALYKFGASDKADQHVRANTLVMADSIKHFVDQGFEELSFGRSSLQNEGLNRFKSGFGARGETIGFFKYALDRNQFVIEPDKAFGWFNRVFMLMPLAVSRIVGTVFYKHLA